MKMGPRIFIWGWIAACACMAAQAQTVHVADGTQVRVRLTADLLSSQVAVGATVMMEISQPVISQGLTVIPAGSVAWGAVQEVKKGKVLNFDVEGVRLPNQNIVKLRVSPRKTTNAGKDEFKVDTQVGGDLGVEKGSEYSAYLDQDMDVAGAPGAPAQPAPGAAPAVAPQPAAPAAAPTPAPAPAQNPAAPAAQGADTPSSPQAQTPSVPRSSATDAPVTAPVAASTALPAAPPATGVQPVEYITVECFSDPLGADVMIDDEYHGSTPSILKLLPGNHRIEYRMIGYKPYSQPLPLKSGDSLTTVRVTLDKLP